MEFDEEESPCDPKFRRDYSRTGHENCYKRCHHPLNCKKILNIIVDYVVHVTDLKSFRLVSKSWFEVSSSKLQSKSTVVIHLPNFEDWIVVDDIFMPPQSLPQQSQPQQSHEDEGSEVRGKEDQIKGKEKDAFGVHSNFNEFKSYIESMPKEKIFFRNYCFIFYDNNSVDGHHPPLLKRSSIDYLFTFNGINAVMTSLHLIRFTCLDDPHKLVTDLFPSLKSVQFDQTAIGISNLAPLRLLANQCHCMACPRGRSVDAGVVDHHHHRSQLCSQCAIDVHSSLTSLEWKATKLYSDNPGRLSRLPPEDYTETSAIILDWYLPFLAFPHLNNLSLVDLNKWEIAECLHILIQLQKKKITNLKLTKLTICELTDLDLLLIMSGDLYETVLQSVEKIISIMPIEHLVLRLKGDVVDLQKILDHCHHTVKTLTLDRAIPIEISLMNKARDVDYKLFRNFFPKLTSLTVSNYYIGSFDDITMYCPDLRSLRVDFDIIEICSSPSGVSFLTAIKDQSMWPRGVFMRTCALETIQNCYPNYGISSLYWNVPLIPFRNLMKHFLNGFTYVPQVFPLVTKLTVTILSPHHFQIIFKLMSQVVELKVLKNSTYSTEDWVITGIATEAQSRPSETREYANGFLHPYDGIATMTCLKRLSLMNDNSELTNESLLNGFCKLSQLSSLQLHRAYKITMTCKELKERYPNLSLVIITADPLENNNMDDSSMEINVEEDNYDDTDDEFEDEEELSCYNSCPEEEMSLLLHGEGGPRNKQGLLIKVIDKAMTKLEVEVDPRQRKQMLDNMKVDNNNSITFLSTCSDVNLRGEGALPSLHCTDTKAHEDQELIKMNHEGA